MNTSKSVLIALFLLLALATAFAASNSTNLTVNSTLQINGAQLKPGDYKVTWTVNNGKADVIFKNGKQEVKASAKVEDAKVVYLGTAVMKEKDGTVKQLWVGGKTTTLIFAE
jgi:hypothetical protein